MQSIPVKAKLHFQQPFLQFQCHMILVVFIFHL